MLAHDVRLTADGGGKVPTIRQILEGKAEVLSFIEAGLRRYWDGLDWTLTDINRTRGVILQRADGVEATVSFAFDAKGMARDIFIVRNPDKLQRLDAVILH